MMNDLPPMGPIILVLPYKNVPLQRKGKKKNKDFSTLHLSPIRTSEITKYSFRLGNRPESSVKSSECRALGNSVVNCFNYSVAATSFLHPELFFFKFVQCYMLYGFSRPCESV